MTQGHPQTPPIPPSVSALQSRRSDGLALASFISSFFTLLCWIGLPVALVTGVIALRRNSFAKGSSKTFAILGLVISSALAVLLAILLAAIIASAPELTPEQKAQNEAQAAAEASAEAKADTEEQARAEAEASAQARANAEESAAAAAEASAQAKADAEEQARAEGRLVGAEREKALTACARQQGGKCIVLGQLEFTGTQNEDSDAEAPDQQAAVLVKLSYENVSDKDISALDGHFIVRDPFGDVLLRDYRVSGEYPVNLGAALSEDLPAGDALTLTSRYNFSRAELNGEYQELSKGFSVGMKDYTTEFTLDKVAYADGTVERFDR